jgi:membrane associated rhomboid family serine protease
MLPLKDDRPSRAFPVITMLLIFANILAFLYQASLQAGAAALDARAPEEFIREFGLVPCNVTGVCGVPPGVPPPAVTVLSSMFLHGGLLHLMGNMLYLWIFGNNVEAALGHGRFLSFYLLSGVLAALVQAALHPHSMVPLIGASGAVAGVLGAYLVMFPRATISTLLILGFFVRLVHVPAMIVLGFWFLIQFGNVLLERSIGAIEGGGVAWFAHVGGFLAGIALLFLMRPRRWARL